MLQSQAIEGNAHPLISLCSEWRLKMHSKRIKIWQ
jgi:hypothetical protein